MINYIEKYIISAETYDFLCNATKGKPNIICNAEIPFKIFRIRNDRVESLVGCIRNAEGINKDHDLN